MIFNSLGDTTYHKLDLYLRSITKKKNGNTSENLSEQEYKSYVKNEFPEQEHFNPKLKYSNREKNIIKRQRYDKLIESEKNENIIFQNVDTSPESEISEKSPELQAPVKQVKKKPGIKAKKKMT